MKKLLILLIVLSTSTFCLAQTDSLKTVKAKNTVFIELLGSGGLYSVNYERVSEDQITIRVGISPLPEIDVGLAGQIGPGFTIPISTSFLHSTDKDSHFEFGIGGTFFLSNNKTGYWVSPIIGFREQNLIKGGGFARVSFTPLIGFDDEKTILFSFGISMGKSF